MYHLLHRAQGLGKKFRKFAFRSGRAARGFNPERRMGQRGVGSQQYQLIARATYLPKGYLTKPRLRLRLRYQLIARATYLPKGHLTKPRLRLCLRYQLIARATYLRCATVALTRNTHGRGTNGGLTSAKAEVGAGSNAGDSRDRSRPNDRIALVRGRR